MPEDKDAGARSGFTWSGFLAFWTSLPGVLTGGAAVIGAIAAVAALFGKAGKFTVNYERLNSTDETGAFLPRKIQENAARVAQDDDTAVYIGDFSSSASTQSILILRRAGIP